MTNIPMTIHRWWQGDPSPHEPWLKLVIENLNPHFEVIDHSDTPTGLKTDQVAPGDLLRHTSNLARYQILNQYGGIWIDHDVIPLRALDELTQYGPSIASINGSPVGCFMAFPPGHPLLVEAISRVEAAPASSLKAYQVSGGDLLADICRHNRDVRFETRLTPFRSDGTVVGVDSPLAVHLWSSSGPNILMDQD